MKNIDLTYVKIRDEDRYVIKVLYLVVGIRVDGYREIFGTKLAGAETEAY